ATGCLRADQPDPHNFRYASGKTSTKHEAWSARFALITKVHSHVLSFPACNTPPANGQRLRSTAARPFAVANDFDSGILCLSQPQNTDLDQLAIVICV